MYNRYIKRLLDILISFIGIIVLFPMFCILMVLVRVKLGSPVIFRQRRPGKNEDIFTLYKFRTMTNQRDKFGKLLPDAERITKFGSGLRRSSLDELPELWNILKGDMSLVGPRPLLIEYLPYYSNREKLRHSVRPGLTGLAQVSGRNFINWDDRLALDVKYVEELTFKNDLKIILRTFMLVINREDIADDTDKVEGNLKIIREGVFQNARNRSDKVN